jgi:hypothetical protein
MIQQKLWWLIAAVVLLAIGVVVTGRYSAARRARIHQELFAEFRPVSLSNCQLERFGEPNDGGYLLCGNLLAGPESGYSYGISGYDGWGCDISRKLNVPVHQYDCFDSRQPNCPDGRTVFHFECVGGERAVDEDGRLFDSVANQVAKNGDGNRRLVVKMDVEGAEWESLGKTPDAVLQRIDQLAVEFHHAAERFRWALLRRLRFDQPLMPRLWQADERAVAVVQRLKRFFYVAHVHFNNYSCTNGVPPFPSWAYEVLFVNKKLGVIDPSGASPKGSLVALDAPNNAQAPDCQTVFP